MRISVIVPIYQVEEYIVRCFESIVSQTYTDLEIVFVDDASTDSSIDILEDLISRYNGKLNLKIITHQNNRGLSAARNSGVEVATGEYVYFLDSDDELSDANAIAKFADCVERTSADVVVGNHRNIKGEDSYISKYKKSIILHGQTLTSAFVKGDIPVTAWNKLINKRLFYEGLRFKEGILNEDELFSYHLLFRNPLIALLGEVTYNYHIRQGSIMTNGVNMHRLVSPIEVYEEVVSSYNAIKGNDTLILHNIDHFAFKRYIDVVCSNANNDVKSDLYKRIRRSQRSIKGLGKMRYVYNGHIYLPSWMGFQVMKLIAKRYTKSRGLA